jgi:uncharacterized membrane protein YcaP (DUF421 family)
VPEGKSDRWGPVQSSPASTLLVNLRERQGGSKVEFERIFFGDIPISFGLEVAFRTAFLYFYTLGLVRLLGKRGMGELSPFDLVIIVGLGSAVGDPMFYADVPLLHGMIVVAVVVGLQRILVRLTRKSPTIERLVESAPVLLVADGEVIATAMRDEELSEAELFMYLRMAEIEHLGQVRMAFIEQNGKVTVFRTENGRTGKSVLPVPG